MIKIVTYNNIHQDGINQMMLEIAQEFDEIILSKPTDSTPLVPNAYWVVLNNDTVIGTIGVIPINEEFAILKRMMLKKEFRGSSFGISKSLLSTVINWCIANNISKIYLGTMHQFKAAQRFYEKNEFKKIKESELPITFIKNPLDSLFFQLNLNE